ncbi:hypothetical protein MYA98_22400 [Salmonella sp. WGH-01]|nr:hypothetical protein MYA98_22400 [Salmonella sp. WGH-01]
MNLASVTVGESPLQGLSISPFADKTLNMPVVPMVMSSGELLLTLVVKVIRSTTSLNKSGA